MMQVSGLFNFRQLFPRLLCISSLCIGGFPSEVNAAGAKAEAMRRHALARAALADKLEAEAVELKAMIAELQCQLAAEKEEKAALISLHHHDEQESRERVARLEGVIAAQERLIEELHTEVPRSVVSIDESPKEEDW